MIQQVTSHCRDKAVSTVGAEFCAMKTAIEMIESLQYKLQMFGVPLDGPANIFCNNEAVYQNCVVPESTLRKKHHSIFLSSMS